MLKKVREFIMEEELTINIYHNKINVINYTSIGHFDNNKVIINHENGKIIIHGQKLVVSKLVTDEVLVVGKLENIEFR